jgi:hypothetical protein
MCRKSSCTHRRGGQAFQEKYQHIIQKKVVRDQQCKTEELHSTQETAKG